MELKKIPSGDHYIHIALSGKLDENVVPAAAKDLEDLLRNCSKPVIVDTTEVGSISPEGIKMFLDLAENQSCMILYNPQPIIREQMETAGFAAKMFLESTLSGALAKVDSFISKS